VANVSLHKLLSIATITKAISRINTPGRRLQQHYGMLPNGSSVQQYGGQVFAYDVQNKTRQLLTARPSGAPAATTSKQKIGQVTVASYRGNESIELLDSRLHRIRPLGGAYGTIDQRGINYVTRQERRLAQKAFNMREFLVSRMQRGSFQFKVDGDDMIPVDSGGHVTVDYKIPAGNKSQLDMLGAGDILGTSWATVASADIVADTLQINAAYEQLHGFPLRHAFCNSTTIQYVLNNAKLQAVSGTARPVFEQYQPAGREQPDGNEDTGFVYKFVGIPWLTFHVNDAGLEVDGTFTKFYPDGYMAFDTDPNNGDVQELYEGSDMIRETVNSSPREMFGLGGWSEPCTNPSGFNLFELDTCLPVLYNPSTKCWAQVAF
jgi:hypothetical protein